MDTDRTIQVHYLSKFLFTEHRTIFLYRKSVCSYECVVYSEKYCRNKPYYLYVRDVYTTIGS